MFRRSLVFSLAALATLMSGSHVDLAHAQSMPAGQVSHRVAHPATAPSADLEKFTPISAKPITQPTQASPNVQILSTEPGSEATKPAPASTPTSSSSNLEAVSETTPPTPSPADDTTKKLNALGSGEIALWNEVVCLDELNSFHVTGLAPNAKDKVVTIDPCQDPDSTTIDTHPPKSMFFSQDVVTDVRSVAALVPDSADKATFNMDLQSAIVKEGDDAKQNPEDKDKADTVIAILRGVGDSVQKIRCFRWVASTITTPGSATTTPSPSTSAAGSAPTPKPQYDYDFRNGLAPLNGDSCDSDAVESFFSVSGPAVAASNAQYQYNAELSTSQLTAQLLTGTLGNKWKRFLPLQLVLSGTATNSSGTSNTNTSSAQNSSGASNIRKKVSPAAATGSAASDSTDPAATAAAQLQAGGDFNISAPIPLFNYASKSNTGFAAQVLFSPNLGFNINGFSGQNTITQATEYAGNLPFEFYIQTRSNESDSNGVASAIFFLDVKPSIELISSALSQNIGPGTQGRSFLGQASVGIELSQRIRISGQYSYSSKDIFNSNASSGSSTTTPQSHNGFHFVVSFSPSKSKSGS